MLRKRLSGRKILLLVLVILSFITISFMMKYTYEVNDNDSTLSLYSCKHVTVEELDQWFHSNEWKEIPKIIHQTWKNKTLRGRQIRWSQTWCEQYTDWFYHLWTDDENDVFVQTKFPWFYPTFKQLSPAILKADSVRYMYMFYYGGLYLDLDYESIRRVDQLFTNKTVVLSLINYAFHSMNSVPNSWMASQPNHPLWMHILVRITKVWSQASDKQRNGFWNGKAEFYTGPQSLFEGLMTYLHLSLQTNKTIRQLFGKQQTTPNAILEVADITFLGPKLINAYDWMNKLGRDECSAQRTTFDESKCKDVVKPIYSVTYWSHTYGHGNQNNPNYLQNK